MMNRLHQKINKFTTKVFSFIPKKGTQAGMSYVELIVVLGIFAALTSVIMFNYGEFGDRIEIKNLASDIGFQILEAQKNALAGRWHASAPACVSSDPSTCWKPAYGVYFNTAVDNKSFNYFVDTNNSNSCADSSCTGELISNLSIKKGNYISSLNVVGTGTCGTATRLSVVFTRPDSNASFDSDLGACTAITEININITSPKGKTSFVRVFDFGKIRIP
ncbi:type II secretion system protein [Candidatus Nomurabacteria bacterium]|nr:type II secretion system protein [Candidatus Nomurabacteria bacterium]